MHDQPLSPDEEARAEAIYARLLPCLDAEVRRLARLMASKDDAHLLGDTEFQVRDRVHELGSQVLQIMLDERKKGGTEDRAPAAPAAGKPPAASAIGTKPSRPCSGPSA